MLDADRGDVALFIGPDEYGTAAVPERLAIFFAGFDVQFQSLSSHDLILALSVSMNIVEAGAKGMSAGNLVREEWAAGTGEISS